jgi:hypothetical protein
LEADRGRLPQEAGAVEAPLLQIPVDGGPGQAALRRLDEPVRGLQAELFQQPDGFTGGEVTLLLVGGPHLDGGDQLAIPLQLFLGQDPGCAAVCTAPIFGRPRVARAR